MAFLGLCLLLEYKQEQEMEIEALESILADEFKGIHFLLLRFLVSLYFCSSLS